MMTAEPQPPAAKPFYRRRWFAWTASIIVALVIVGAVVAVTLLAFWKNSPERALLDAVQYAVKTPGLYHVKTDGIDVKIVSQDRRYGLTGTINTMPVEAVLYGGTLYVRSSEPEKLYDFFTGTKQPNQQLQAIVRAVASTIRDKWISINLSSITGQSQQVRSAQCGAQVRDSVANNPAAWSQIQSAYMPNRFVQKIVAENDTYDVSVDGSILATFWTTIQRQEFYKALTDCEDMPKEIPGGSTKAKVVLKRQDSQFVVQSATLTSQGKSPVSIVADYANVPSVKVPTDATGINQLLIRVLQAFKSPA